MKIIKVEATPINVPITVDVLDLRKKTNLSICLVRVETDDGHSGFGITGITEEESLRQSLTKWQRLLSLAKILLPSRIFGTSSTGFYLPAVRPVTPLMLWRQLILLCGILKAKR